MKQSTESAKHVNDHDVRLSKRLAYILRYGAEREGLSVHDGGWIKLTDLATVPMLKWYSYYQLMKEIINSKTQRGGSRYEKRHEGDVIYVRATYGRRMERDPCHSNSSVKRLVEQCMDTICARLDHFDLEDFPDEYLINMIIHRLRRQKRLNNRALKCLLGPTLEQLDLGASYITETTIKLVAQKCRNLKVLTLRDCGYALTDHLMERLLKHTTQLESLNIAACHHITDLTITALCKHCQHLQHLNISGIPGISQDAVLHLLTTNHNLTYLEMYDNKNISEEGKEVIRHMVQEKHDLIVVLEEISVEEEMSGENTLKFGAGSANGLPTTNGNKQIALAGIGNDW